MRKLIWLALAALLAGTIYAETSPAFSGEFEFYNTYDINKKDDDTGGEDDDDFVIGNKLKVEVELNGVVDEWTTVDAKLKNEYVATKDDQNHDVQLEEFTMTNNLTGALGFADSPVGVSLTWGKSKIEPSKFHEVAGEEYLKGKETDKYYGIKPEITILEKAKLIVAIFPETYLSDYYAEGRKYSPVVAFELHLLELVEGLNIGAYYISDKNKNKDLSQVGIAAGYGGIDSWNFGFATSLLIDAEAEEKEDKLKEFGVGVSAKYSLDRFITSLALVVDKFPKKKTTGEGSAETVTTYPIELHIGWDARLKAVVDTLDLVFNVQVPFKGKTKVKIGDETEKTSDKDYLKENMSFDVGIEAFLGSITYGLGYEQNNRNEYSPNDDRSTGVYFKVKAEF